VQVVSETGRFGVDFSKFGGFQAGFRLAENVFRERLRELVPSHVIVAGFFSTRIVFTGFLSAGRLA
jgi:hypothetical protein